MGEGGIRMYDPVNVETVSESRSYEPPRVEALDLACEISSYAPDVVEPLF
jgi:hypothetical protein